MITFVSIALRGQHGDKATLVDLDTAMQMSGTKLYGITARSGTYVGFTIPGKRSSAIQPLHRDLLGLEQGDKMQVDHLNGDTLDNRKRNLEVVTAGENRVRAFRRAKNIAA